MTLSIGPLHSFEVDEVVALHQRAFPNFFLSQLGPAFLSQFYRGFLNDPSAVTVVAKDNQHRIVGVVVGTTAPSGFFSRLLRRRLAGFVAASTIAALRDPRRIIRLVRGLTYRGEASGPRDGALLSSICVFPAAQGGGVGRSVLTAWEEAVQERGCSCAYLTTDRFDNDPVNAFYIRAGWVAAETFTTPEGRQMNLYTKDLS